MTLVRCACWEFRRSQPVFRSLAGGWADPGGRGPALARSAWRRLCCCLVFAERPCVRAVGAGIMAEAAGSRHIWETGGWRALSCPVDHRPAPIAPLTFPILWVAEGWQGMGNEPIQRTCLPLAGRSLGWPSGHSITAFAALGSGESSGVESPEPGCARPQFCRGHGLRGPGRLLALGLMLFRWAAGTISPLNALIGVYGVRFLAVSKQGLDAALERLCPPSIDRNRPPQPWGCSWFAAQAHPSASVEGADAGGQPAGFVMWSRRLPLTSRLRPFDFGTPGGAGVPVRQRERGGGGHGPALMIMVLGWSPPLALPSLESLSQDTLKRFRPVNPTNSQLRSRRDSGHRVPTPEPW